MRAPALLERPEIHPEVMLRKPVIRGTHVAWMERRSSHGDRDQPS
jgi:hypothetical protein